jgi:hypothetical protein
MKFLIFFLVFLFKFGFTKSNCTSCSSQDNFGFCKGPNLCVLGSPLGPNSDSQRCSDWIFSSDDCQRTQHPCYTNSSNCITCLNTTQHKHGCIWLNDQKCAPGSDKGVLRWVGIDSPKFIDTCENCKQDNSADGTYILLAIAFIVSASLTIGYFIHNRKRKQNKKSSYLPLRMSNASTASLLENSPVLHRLSKPLKPISPTKPLTALHMLQHDNV